MGEVFADREGDEPGARLEHDQELVPDASVKVSGRLRTVGPRCDGDVPLGRFPT